MEQNTPTSKNPPTYSKAIFIFVSLLLGGVTLASVRELPVATAVGLIILLFTHLLLHWFCPRWTKGELSWLVYALIQGGIMTAMTLLAGNASIWGVALTWLVAEAVGFLSSMRTTAVSLLIYVFAGVGTLFAAFGQTTALEWLTAILPTAVFIGIIIYLYKRQVEATEKSQQLVTELEAANRQISDYAEQVEALTITHERQRIARELHDTLAQGLAGLVLQLEAVNAHLSNGRTDRAQTIVQEAMSKSRTTLAAARAAIGDLRDQESMSLSQQIEEMGHRFQAENSLPCTISVDSGVWQTRLSVDQQEQIERFVAECLTNIQRHAQATAVNLTLRAKTDCLTLKIEDNGRGFDPEQVPRQGHYGLRGLRERTRILNGTLQIESTPGEGTTILLTMPLARDNMSAGSPP